MAGDHYFRKTIDKPGNELVSIRNNDPVSPADRDSIINKLSRYTDAFYQTARYMLYHNKKE